MIQPLDPKRTASAQSAIAPNIVTERLAESETLTIGKRFQRHRNPLASFLVSLLAHTLLLLALLLIVYSLPQPIPRISVVANFAAENVPLFQTDVELNTVEIELPDTNQSPIELTEKSIATESTMKISESPSNVINTIAENTAPNDAKIERPVAPRQTLPTGGGLSGRDATARARLAASRGGSVASELAVENGIRWILDHQRNDGSWRFHHDDGKCNGECQNEGTRESSTAATGLSLLALHGAGYTHRTGPHQEAVQKGLNYLLEKIRFTPHGGIIGDGERNERMYAQAIATMALAEAYSMTKDTSLLKAIGEARTYIVKAQHRGGSWGYDPGSPGDITVTGWQLMALKSCQMAGIGTPPPVWQSAEKFIDSMASSNSAFGYKSPESVTHATTAVGLLSKMYLGLPKEHRTLAAGGNLLVDYQPSTTDIYFNYYATQVLHHCQGPNWKIWNEQMREFLIETQAKTQGHADGSWYFVDSHAAVGGRLYTTAMAVMTLEVYYRYLPLYEEQAIVAENLR